MEIITSRVSVYEIELDLKKWDKTQTNQVPSFYNALSNAITSIKEHKCMSGLIGGFLVELRNGTNFAHVIEHVILELIHLADPEQKIYTGWTRKKSDQTYIIHYSAPDFLAGRLAAILGVDLVKRLINEERVDINYYIDLLKQPLKYFTQDNPLSASLADLSEPISIIQEIDNVSESDENLDSSVSMTDQQMSNVKSILTQIKKHLNFIVEVWRKSFLEYSGNFGRSIIDKIELINIEKFIDLLVSGDFQGFFRGVKGASQVIGAYRIPINFTVHSIWLYKNKLLNFLIEEFEDDKKFLHQVVNDFEVFYQVILQNVMEGFSTRATREGIENLGELKEFREIRERKGCILVVDDDEMSRRAFRDILEYQGHKTILAQDGAKALELLAEKDDEVSLIILDVFMPGMSGEEVYSRIKNIRPEAKVLISSGYPIDRETQGMFSQEPVSFIGKPFKVKDFLAKVQSLLDS